MKGPITECIFWKVCGITAPGKTTTKGELLKLLYQSLRALCAKSLAHELVRYIFEIKTVAINGEFPGIPMGTNFGVHSVCRIVYCKFAG